MKALFIGGTGTISMAITRQLSEHPDWELYLLNRGNRASDVPVGVHSIIADISNEDDCRQKIKDLQFDVVCDFIAFTKEQVERDYRLFNSRTKQYIFISSASAYQKPLSGAVITESTPLANPYWEYSRNKIACEEFLMSKYREHQFPVTIVRQATPMTNVKFRLAYTVTMAAGRLSNECWRVNLLLFTVTVHLFGP